MVSSAIELYILKDEWASIVRRLKETITKEPKQIQTGGGERQDINAYTTELLARAILRHIEDPTIRIRQYNLFTQRRGEDYEKMLAKLEDMGFELEHIQRIIDDEDFWKTTLELAE